MRCLQGDATTTITLDDSFERCAMHGLAAFHGLLSAGVATGDGARGVRLRWPAPIPTAAHASPSRIPAGGAVPRSRLSCSKTRARGDTPGSSTPRHAAPGAKPSENPVRRSSEQRGGSAGAPAASGSVESGGGMGLGASVSLDSTGAGWGGWRSGGEVGGGAPMGEVGAGGVIPFTAVDVLMVLHEDATGRAEAGLAAGLTAAALKQHRADHLPPELTGVL